MDCRHGMMWLVRVLFCDCDLCSSLTVNRDVEEARIGFRRLASVGLITCCRRMRERESMSIYIIWR